LWDILVLEVQLDQSKRSLILASVLAALLIRVNEKVKLIRDIEDFLFLFKMEALLIGPMAEFVGDDYQISS